MFEDMERMMATNFAGVFVTAQSCARQMLRYKVHGSICIIASMSGVIANKGFSAAVYNSSKAAVIQLTRNLAMEWGRIRPDGSGGIRVNCISPGHILTPMVEENFRKGEANREEWEQNNMLGRISFPEEYKGPGLFLLSKTSSFMVSLDDIVHLLDVLITGRRARTSSSTVGARRGRRLAGHQLGVLSVFQSMAPWHAEASLLRPASLGPST